jgi:ATP-dependent Lon protease
MTKFDRDFFLRELLEIRRELDSLGKETKKVQKGLLNCERAPKDPKRNDHDELAEVVKEAVEKELKRLFNRPNKTRERVAWQ